MCLDMIAAGSGYKFDFIMLAPGTDLGKEKSVTDAVDMAMLPKAIGGGAVSVGEDGAEDEHCSRGFDHPTVSTFVAGLGE